jgi:nucleotide-binding universal stress UspA family protein
VGRIVVGVDGSPESRAALRWAVGEAKLRHATLEAVCAWSFPVIPGRDAPPLLVPVEELRDEAERMLSSLLAEEAPDVGITQTVVEGNPADLLVDISDGADMLVVGSRGHGGFAGLLLGSVSSQCSHHAACPVVIIRPGVAV